LGGYVCMKCTIEYWPKQQPVKKPSKFDLPGPPTDSHGNIIEDNDIPKVTIDTPREASSTSYKQLKLSPSFGRSRRRLNQPMVICRDGKTWVKDNEQYYN
jgi:hypothetical protein